MKIEKSQLLRKFWYFLSVKVQSNDYINWFSFERLFTSRKLLIETLIEKVIPVIRNKSEFGSLVE